MIAGTLIDMDMSDTMKVTVVVTGIEKVATKKGFGIEKGANNHSKRENNYSSKPTTSFLRKEAEVVSTPSSSSSSEEANKSDIPSFLRRR